MQFSTLGGTVAVLIALGASAAAAATYNFAATYDGATIALDAGSDDPDGLELFVGDSFEIDLRSAGSDFWRVTEEVIRAFVPLTFYVPEDGNRTVDIMTTWSLDGVETASQSELGAIQGAAHIGAQEWSLGLGIEFDRVLISLVLNESTAPTLIDASGPTIFYFAEGLFFDLGPTSGKIEYVSDVAAIPLPAAGMLYLPLLAAGALALRRRKRG
jgi:hypothetical protein